MTFLPLILAIMLIGCGGKDPVSREDQQSAAFADLRSAVRESVSDDERQTKVLEIVDDLEKDVDELRALLVRRREKLRALNADYDTTRDEFVAFTGEMESRIQSGRRSALEQHQRLAASLTAEEWELLARAETRAMKAIASSVQGM